MDDKPNELADESSPATRVIEALAAEMAASVTTSYRIDSATALTWILELWRKDRSLLRQATAEPDAARLKRTRIYKQAATQAKTDIYNRLRRYRPQGENSAVLIAKLRQLASTEVTADSPQALALRDRITAAHISTQERLEDLDGFYRAIFAKVPAAGRILDIGCGVQPMLFPFATHPVTDYVALDRDAASVEAVAAWGSLFTGSSLRAMRWSLDEGFTTVAGPNDPQWFDLALALKFVPVVDRQERQLLAMLRSVPATVLLVTGACQAMVKRRSISHREERTLRQFAEQNDFEVIDTLQTSSEVGLFLKRNGK